MKKSKMILWGIVLVLFGILLAVNSMGIFEINPFFDGWWTLLIIVPCFISLFTDKDKMASLIGIIIGVFLLFCSQNLLSFDLFMKLVLPIIIIILGFKLIFTSSKGAKSDKVMKEVIEQGGNVRNVSATFSGQNLVFNGEEFNGAEFNAIFGGIKCDLRNAVIPKDCVIKSTAIFGGIDLIVPDNINVKVNSTSIFGGVSDKKGTSAKESTATIYLEGLCLFGGVDIK